MLEGLRADLSRKVATDGADAHQVAIDHLVWGHAYVEAARSLREWADRTREPLASDMADAAHAEATAAVCGRAITRASEDGARLAAIASRFVSVEDLDATAEERLLRSTLRSFATEQIRPFAQQIHRDDLDLPETIISGMAALGLFGLSIPQKYGGVQDESSDLNAMLIATEELSRGSLAAGGSLMTRPEILVSALVRAGTEEQKRRWLPAIASGRALVAVAVTEPNYGSDVSGIRCRATRRANGDWEIGGAKLWCTFAARSELLMILCRTADLGHKGLSIFVLEKPAFGGHSFEHLQPHGGSLRGRAIPTIGYRGMHTFELVFDRYRAPALALLGGEEWRDRGFYVQMESFAVGRLQTAGRAIGVMQAALDDAIAFSKQRIVFGRPEHEFQLVRAKIGAMAVRLEAARRLSYRAARLLQDGIGGQIEASLAKLFASRMAELVTREAMQLCGAMGYAEETDVSRYFVDARVLAIFEGAEDVLSLRVIGRSLLGR